MKKALLLIVLVTLIDSGSSLCASAGSGCQDTGCRLHGGRCNIACVCMQRENNNLFGFTNDLFIGSTGT
uniref:Uncharacterized protein n=1 Tax=Plectus sambesii TaxID=2011161 RepID=A0A914WY89_9BILA